MRLYTTSSYYRLLIHSVFSILSVEIFAIKKRKFKTIQYKPQLFLPTHPSSVLSLIENFGSKHSHPISPKQNYFIFQAVHLPYVGSPHTLKCNGTNKLTPMAKKAYQHLPMADIPIPVTDLKLLVLKVEFQNY